MDFRILGPLEVHDANRLIPLGGGKLRAVVAILLLHANEAVSPDRLIDLLWGNAPPPTATQTVQVFVSRLRKALGAAGGDAAKRIVTHPTGYLIQVERDELDLHRFERLAQDGRALLDVEPARASTLLADALALWRGPPLADFAYEPFAQTAIARLEELRITALEDRLEADLACGREREAVAEIEALVRAHPLRERLRGHLMLALYRSGRQAEALEAFQDTRRLLVDELGIEPGPELQRLERAILVQDAELELRGPAPAGVPAQEAAEGASEGTGGRRSILLAGGDGAGLPGLLELALPLARSHAPHDLILAQLVAGSEPEAGDELARASAALNETRRELAAGGVSARVAAFTSEEPARDLVRLASEQEVDMLLLSAPPAALDERMLPPDLAAVLGDAPCDVALVVDRAEPGSGPGPVIVPFGGTDHDWAALELGAWLAHAMDEPLVLLGTEAQTDEGKRDASRLLAHAALAVQQLVGVTTEPRLISPGAHAVVEASNHAGAIVLGIPETWRQDGVGTARAAVAKAARPAALLARRGLRPGGLAPKRDLTRFTWSMRLSERDG